MLSSCFLLFLKNLNFIFNIKIILELLLFKNIYTKNKKTVKIYKLCKKYTKLLFKNF